MFEDDQDDLTSHVLHVSKPTQINLRIGSLSVTKNILTLMLSELQTTIAQRVLI